MDSSFFFPQPTAPQIPRAFRESGTDWTQPNGWHTWSKAENFFPKQAETVNTGVETRAVMVHSDKTLNFIEFKSTFFSSPTCLIPVFAISTHYSSCNAFSASIKHERNTSPSNLLPNPLESFFHLVGDSNLLMAQARKLTHSSTLQSETVKHNETIIFFKAQIPPRSHWKSHKRFDKRARIGEHWRACERQRLTRQTNTNSTNTGQTILYENL